MSQPHKGWVFYGCEVDEDELTPEKYTALRGIDDIFGVSFIQDQNKNFFVLVDDSEIKGGDINGMTFLSQPVWDILLRSIVADYGLTYNAPCWHLTSWGG
jgi:hypothetical protein